MYASVWKTHLALSNRTKKKVSPKTLKWGTRYKKVKLNRSLILITVAPHKEKVMKGG